MSRPRKRMAGAASRSLSTVGLAATVLLSACTPTSLVIGLAGIATDTSVSWEIAKHFHAKLTEGQPVHCNHMNSVQRALHARCGPFESGSLRTSDLQQHGLPACPLGIAAREPELWPVLPELIAKGVTSASCDESPLAMLARQHPCPDFASAGPAERQALQQLALEDPRALQHDVVRLLSCPSARQAGMDNVIVQWLQQGRFQQALGFGALGALHPEALLLPWRSDFERQGQTAELSLMGYQGRLSSGFEEALKTGNLAALEWWLTELPRLRDQVPAKASATGHWVPLVRVLSPAFMVDPEHQRSVVGLLLARGADPWRAIPGAPYRTPAGYAKHVGSHLADMLDPPVPVRPTADRSRVANEPSKAPTLSGIPLGAEQGGV